MRTPKSNWFRSSSSRNVFPEERGVSPTATRRHKKRLVLSHTISADVDLHKVSLEHAGLDVDGIVEYHARAVSCHRGDGRNGKGLAVDYDGLAMPVSSGVSVSEYIRG